LDDDDDIPKSHANKLTLHHAILLDKNWKFEERSMNKTPNQHDTSARLVVNNIKKYQYKF